MWVRKGGKRREEGGDMNEATKGTGERWTGGQAGGKRKKDKEKGRLKR